MKPELKVKFLQHLNQKKQDAGFTLIELLVVIIIIGILAAIALPSFLSQAAKGRAAEAKSNIGAMNRAQQAFFLQQQTFTYVINDLGLSTPTQTTNFTYSAAVALGTSSVTNFGSSLKPDIKSYAGGVFYSSTANNTASILCESNTPGAGGVSAIPTSTPACGANSKIIQ